jgi:N-acetylneuraminic acid mutarotase
MKKIIFSLCMIALVNNISNAQSHWFQKSSMFNYGRHVAVSFIIDNKAYVGLGEIYDGTKVSDFWEYDPLTNIWTQKASFPGGGRYSATGFSINGYGFVCLGLDPSGELHHDLWEYRPDVDVWVRRADFPGEPRYGASCFVIGDSAFVGTGSTGNSYGYLYDMWMYVESSNTWTRKADFLGFNRCHATAFSIGGNGYLGTGLENDSTLMKDLWRYNPKHDLWSPCQDLPGPSRLGAISFVLGGDGYIGLGYNQEQDFNDFYQYDTITYTWNNVTSDSNIIPRRGAVGFSIDQTGYFCTGETNYGLLSDLWAYNPDVIPSKLPTETESSSNFEIFPNPVRDRFIVKTSKVIRNSSLYIYCISGKEVLKTKLLTNNEIISIDFLPCGMYIAKIVDEGYISNFQIIKIN